MQSRSKGVEHDVYGRTEGQIQLRSLRRIGKDLAKLKLIFVFERETIRCHCLVLQFNIYLPRLLWWYWYWYRLSQLLKKLRHQIAFKKKNKIQWLCYSKKARFFKHEPVHRGVNVNFSTIIQLTIITFLLQVLYLREVGWPFDKLK